MIDDAVSYLFVPGDRPERFLKAIGSGTDVTVFDLEDSVAPAAKRRARDAVAAACPALLKAADDATAALCIRINSVREGYINDDLELCRKLKPAFVMVSKVETETDLAFVTRELPSAALLALIETATGVIEAKSIAASKSVARLVLGSVDLMLNLGTGNTDEALDFVRSRLVLASVASGIGAPIDGVCLAIRDAERTKAEASRARSFGFGGKLCIHPSQISAVRDAFNVTHEELSWATQIIAVAEASNGAATAVDGMMIDAPVLRRAQNVVARYCRTSSLDG